MNFYLSKRNGTLRDTVPFLLSINRNNVKSQHCFMTPISYYIFASLPSRIGATLSLFLSLL